MKISEALKIINSANNLNEEKHYSLVCGFTPIHLQTFLTAYLQYNEPRKKVKLVVGVFGNIIDNLSKVIDGNDVFIFIEWFDFDERLSARSLGGWSQEVCNDIEISFFKKLSLFLDVFKQKAGKFNITVCLPITPILPIDNFSSQQASTFSLNIRTKIFEFSSAISKLHGVNILNPDWLSKLQENPFYNFKSDLEIGFPYTIEASAILAECASKLATKEMPKKGIITDLDNTCWRGILGDDGLEGIFWTQEDKAQVHGLYQQLLQSFAISGVLVGIASKNNLEIVCKALRMENMMLKHENVFPIEANWERKSKSVKRIIEVWNISANDIVFVDDNAFELEEVKSKFPNMECILFPNNASLVYELLLKLRHLFGKNEIFDEDILRSLSIKNAAKVVDASTVSDVSEEELMEALNATVTISISNKFPIDRSFELVNKTNQFNLNGKRYDVASWNKLANEQNRFLATTEYSDKYGPLGRISVISGTIENSKAFVDIWVLSCRAFSRRIEYKILDFIFKYFNLEEIVFDVKFTEKNSLVQSLFDKMNIGFTDENRISINKKYYQELCPKLYQHENLQLA